MEQKIISAALTSRKHYDRIAAYNPQTFLSDMGKIIWKHIVEYYQEDASAESIDLEILRSRIRREVPKHFEAFNGLLHPEEISGPNLELEIALRRKESISSDIILALSQRQETKARQLFAEYAAVGDSADTQNASDRIFNGADLSKITTNQGKRIPIGPQALNDTLKGGALPQHHILLFAVTEMGKSFMALNMARVMVQNGFKVLYLQNEDPGEDMHRRFLRGITELTEDEIDSNPERAIQISKERGGDLFNLIEMYPGNLQEVESWIRKIDPDVFFVDQIKNMDMGKVEGDSFEAAAQGMRNLAKRYKKLAVSLAQAGDRATGKRILAVNDIHNSRVSVPGACDLMIGIGGTEEMVVSSRRTLSRPKNKISGIKVAVDCVFDLQTMRVV